MRETSFIDQNKQKWDEFEKKFETEKDPEKVSNLFIQITDDLSYSRTYYPNRSVKIYLNNLAQKVFHSIYKNKVRRRRKLVTFWKDELPQRMHAARWQLLFTFCLFMISFFIGVFSSMHDSEFSRFILGDSYINMTEENIESGDPMKVYKEMNEFDMFFAITFNNLRVSFLTLIFGIFFGLGTAYFIIYNGIMVGAFQYFFIEKGLFWESFLTIWVHGALEISAIVIAGTAGITLGRGLLFPGTFTRMQSFRINGMRAVQIFLGIAPIIVLAGINESFLTRHTDTPDYIRAILIAVEFAFMLFYFVIYPARKARSGFNTNRRSDEIPADKTPEFNLNKIKNNGVVFADGFMILRQFIKPVLITIFSTAALYTGIYFWKVANFSQVYHEIHFDQFNGIFEAVRDVRDLLDHQGNYFLMAINILSLTILSAVCFYIVQLIKTKNLQFSIRGFIQFLFTKGWFILILSTIMHTMLLIDSGFFIFCFFLILPVLFFIFADIVNKNKISGKVFSSGSYFFRHFLTIQLLYLPLLLLSIMLSLMAHSIICYFNIELIKWNIPFDPYIYEAVQDISVTFILIATVFLQICMVAINMGILYYSFYEIDTAEELRTRIQKLAFKPTKSGIA